MSDQKTGTYSVHNPTRGPRVVNRADGSQQNIAAGATVEGIEMTDAEVKFTEARGDVRLTKTKSGKAAAQAAAPKKAGTTVEGGADGGDAGGDTNENPAGVVSYIGHEAFGRYYGFNEDGVKVEGVGPFKEDEGKTWATENKVDFRPAGEKQD